MSKRQTYTDRSRIKSELADKFLRWNTLNDDKLMAEVVQRAPDLGEHTRVMTRTEMLKFLTLDHLDKIN